MAEPFLSSSWYRVYTLKPKLRLHVRIHRHRYRGSAWYVVQDPSTGKSHRFTPLAYYFIANLAALTQPAGDRRYPRPLQVLGLAGCAVLALTLPPASVVGGIAVVAVGVAARATARRVSPRRRSSS